MIILKMSANCIKKYFMTGEVIFLSFQKRCRLIMAGRFFLRLTCELYAFIQMTVQ
jgi:hypothetical protein